MNNKATLPDNVFNEDNIATYCPEDNKLRLYVGLVSRDEYLYLRSQGWSSTPKQDCNFVSTWRPSREDTALAYAGIILDEDQTPEERAADRAERFGGYLDKRRGEAHDYANTYDAGPAVHGYQNQQKAERAAARHDRQADKAVDAWSKAEYWQRRTAAVIAHALHKSSPGVRMGRIKILEADIRKEEKNIKEYCNKWKLWDKIAQIEDEEKRDKIAGILAGREWGDYTHPRTGEKTYLYHFADENAKDRLTGLELRELWLANNPEHINESRFIKHCRLRLAYENQMLEAAGGRAAPLFQSRRNKGRYSPIDNQKQIALTRTGQNRKDEK